MLNSKALAASASAAKVYVEDVFSTWLYTGNGGTQTITNGIDLSGKGGLVWIKGRSGATGHRFTDTTRGATKSLESNSTAAEVTESTGLTSFSGTGFALGADADYNTSAATYASWTFRKAEKFFDVCTWTGSGANRTISHNLGSVPGCIIVKRTDTTADWQVYHRSLANTEYMVLNSTAAKATGATRWNSTTPTSTVFSLGTDATVNASGGTYVAYLFAHDAGGFGDSGSDSVVSCGSFTNNASAPVVVNLGWEPQWILVKSSNSSASWAIVDNMRGIDAGKTSILRAESSNAENVLGQCVTPTATGFEVKNNVTATLNSAATTGTITYIYIAIRRGPMKTPTDATKVFYPYSAAVPGNAVVTTGFPVDLQIQRSVGDVDDTRLVDRIRGVSTTPVSPSSAVPFLISSATNAESTGTGIALNWTNVGFTVGSTYSTDSKHLALNFRRAPGFFDVVAYAGTGVARTVSHNLGVAPELMIVKSRSNIANWVAYSASAGSNSKLFLNATNAASSDTIWNNTTPTSAVFSVDGSSVVNQNAYTYIAYLFATCPGVSKVGSYTGTGTTKDIDCGFTNGARFVLIKRTDSTGDWYVWDAARGIVSGNDSYLLLNSSAAEVTNTDYIDPLSSGFQISSTAPAAINANGGSFIYLAIA